MKISIIKSDGINIAMVENEDILIKDVQSALDLAVNILYEYDCSRIIIRKELVIRDFFILSSRLAGDILQKYSNYKIKIAIVGDYSKYTSKPLKDFIYESNKGKDFFFVSTVEEAIDKLRQK
ncbi:MAG TPA: DUF4180 domain-containing protein [Petrotogaceae bacterium]|jgi:hypothetical protein|nr:DUF4180 domain-containing protein [Petrotogaceae bacterium]HQO12594.1 DUF4180 domain-containing protein [Petrotogaceae bacterium]HQP57403.1 DUF4180 domain-containing protein [Petrotogaceae bacterium]